MSWAMNIIEFLDKSRSAMSRTHTTSTAPAPALAPATMAYASKTKTIIEYLHSEEADPNHLAYANARNDEGLQALAGGVLPALKRKQTVLGKYLASADEEKIHVSEKTKAFWREKKAAVEVLLEALENAGKAEGELDADGQRKRAAFLTEARQAWEVSLKDVLVKINDEIIGPFSLGDQLSLADLHLASWLARIVSLSGGTYEDDGQTAIGKLETHIGDGFGLVKDAEEESKSKLCVFWDAVRGRGSWKRVYGEGIF
ncbi:hypothetical protein H0H81_005299 [Sphagnurus paluster]|uniref:Glutathione S-transferase n=1 Tax=Sphagnurus paluster TaxID=117069 RepID=A0A9P7K7T2_9AGAR|nr:hypothetical protein H0H81_005299 [Sphagnurus paluster]